jgi:glycosyltransferase involved in cell wall biosynthesis
MGRKPQLSAVICTINRPELIGAAVESVLANDHPSFELLVVDQSRDAATETVLQKFRGDQRFRYVRIERVGLSAAYNAAIEMTNAPILARIDDDCTAPVNWLSSIEAAFERYPDVELLYGQMLVPPELKGALGVVPGVSIPREQKLGKGYGFRIGAMGSNFAMWRTLVSRIGGFDESLGAGGPLRSAEDFDFQYRAYREGAICLRCPDVWVYHYGLRAPQEWRDTLKAYGIGDGAFYLKHVRCGDFMALRLLLTRMARLAGRELRNTIRRRPVQWTYLRSYFTGMRLSLRYGVDRKRRLYRLTGSPQV